MVMADLRGIRKYMRTDWSRLSACLVAVWLAVAALSAQAQAQTRAALIIGNNGYAGGLTRLANAVNDATGVAAELRKSGFDVNELRDAGAAEIGRSTQRFLQSIANGGVGVFYFSGHGVQIQRLNYLIPVDYSAGKAVPTEGLVSVSALLDAIDAAKPKLVVIVLDACRNDPFPPGVQAKPAGPGLSEVARPMPAGTLVVYAASSNQTALDSIAGENSEHGLFTGALLETMRQSNLEIRDIAHRVRYTVMQKARSVGHRQIPAIYENLAAGELYLSPRQPPRSPPPAALPAQIRLVLPFAAGGPSDTLVRAALPLLAKELGREVVAENVIDVQGDRVTEMLAAGPKDGSLLLVSPFAAAARRLRTNDPRLAPVAMLFDTPLSIAVNVRSPARTLGEMLDGARQQGRKLVMQVSNPPGSPTDICGQQVVQKLGAGAIELLRVNGEALAVQAGLEGRADLVCVSTIALRSMSAANPNFGLKELAEVRWSAAPSTEVLRVQPTGPQGYDIVAPNWLAVFASAEVSGGARETIAAAIGRLQRSPAFVQAAKRGNGLPVSADQATPGGLLNALRLGVALQDVN
jgi:tripartite-type tricarboxylate transporter receptor subunit TctC